MELISIKEMYESGNIKGVGFVDELGRKQEEWKYFSDDEFYWMVSSINYVNGRKLIDSGIEVALATDFNPGSCTINSLPMIMQLAVLNCGLTIEETFKGVTWNAAKSLNRHLNNGIIKNEYNADFILWDIESLDEIPYWFGNDRIVSVYKNGLQIYSSS